MAPGAGIVVFCCLFSGRGSQGELWTAAAHCESDGSGAPTGSSEKYPDAGGGPSDGAGLGVGVGVGAGVGVGVEVAVGVDVGVGVGAGVVVSVGDFVAAAVGVLGAHVFDLWHLRAPFVSDDWLNGPVPAMATPNAEESRARRMLSPCRLLSWSAKVARWSDLRFARPGRVAWRASRNGELRRPLADDPS